MPRLHASVGRSGRPRPPWRHCATQAKLEELVPGSSKLSEVMMWFRSLKRLSSPRTPKRR